MKSRCNLYLSLFALFSLLLLVACPTSDERAQILTMEITEQNDSLLSFDTVIVTVHSNDGKFTQEVFHGVLRNAKQVSEMPLDPRVGQEYTVTLVGYKNGKISVNKEISFIGDAAQTKDLPIKPDIPETVVVEPNLPEIMAPSDTNIAEGDSLRFRVTVRNPWAGATPLSLRDAIPGAALHTEGRDPGDGFFTWRPTFDQGRAEPYAVSFVYVAGDKKVEKLTRVKVLNINRAPRIAEIPDQMVMEGDPLKIGLEISDPDHDSLTLDATGLPAGATFKDTAFEWKPAEGQAGNYSVRFRVSDGIDSNVAMVLITVGNVEVPPPLSVKIISPAQDTLVNITPITILYLVNGTSLQMKQALKNGNNHIRIDTIVLNRPGFDTVNITLDTIPPSAPLVTGDSPVRLRTPTWNWSSGGNGIGIYRYRLDNEDMSGSTIMGTTSYTASTDLEPGIHTLFVQERDSAGNWSRSGLAPIRIDTVKPEPPTVSVSPSSPTNDSRPIWTWVGAGDDVTGWFRYRIDTADFLSGSTETKTTSFQPAKGKELAEGIHTLFIQQKDSAGNWSPTSSKSIRIDLTPPKAPLDAGTLLHTTRPRPTWHWKGGGDGAGIFRVKMSDSVMESGSILLPDSNFTPSADLNPGVPYTLYIQEKDSAGNWSATMRLSTRIHSQIGYAVGNSGTIIKTLDGGASWDTTIRSGTTQNLLAVCFTDVNTGYAVGEGGVILKTATGGGFWYQLAGGTNEALRSLFFTSEKKGIVVGANGTIIQTTDGTNWNRLSSGTNQSLATVFFADSKVGYAAGDSGIVLKSVDGGYNWRPISSSMKDRIGSLYFTDANTGYAVGQEGIFKTVDGGSTWVSQPSGLAGSPTISNYLVSATFTDLNTGYAIRRDYGGLTKTTNGGTPWVELKSGLARYLQTICFIDSSTGFVAGSFGSISKSVDVGASWTPLTTGISSTINALDFP